MQKKTKGGLIGSLLYFWHHVVCVVPCSQLRIPVVFCLYFPYCILIVLRRRLFLAPLLAAALDTPLPHMHSEQ